MTVLTFAIVAATTTFIASTPFVVAARRRNAAADKDALRQVDAILRGRRDHEHN